MLRSLSALIASATLCSFQHVNVTPLPMLSDAQVARGMRFQHLSKSRRNISGAGTIAKRRAKRFARAHGRRMRCGH